MKQFLLTFSLVLAALLPARAGDSAAEKAFLDKFKTAFESKDTATLESFLYKEGAHPKALEFYKMMLLEGAGSKIAKLELVDLSADELKKAAGSQEGPDGKMTKMPIPPTKKLNLTIEASGPGGTSSSTSSPLVAEKDGKFVIPVPAAAK